MRGVRPGKPAHALAAGADRSGIALRVAAWGLAALVAVTFGRICFNQFTWWDDDLTIHHNLNFDPPIVRDVLMYWRKPQLGMYVPVTYSAWGMLAFVSWSPTPDAAGIHIRPLGYHLTSLLVHLATVLLVFALLHGLFRQTWAAFAGAALYAVHPVQVETVAWATSLKEGLCGLFGMLALWYYVQSAGSRGRRRLSLYMLAAISIVLAQLSNPLAVVIPLMAFVLDWLVVRRPWRTAVAWAGPLLLVAAVDAVIARIVQPGIAAPAIPLWARPLVAADTVAFYLFKLVWPLHLATDYGRRPNLALERRWLYWTWIIPVAVCIVVIARRRRGPWVAAGALLFVIGVAPVLGMLPFDFQQFSTPADRYLHLAMFGPALIVCAWFAAQEALKNGNSTGGTPVPQVIRPSLDRKSWQRIAWCGVIAVLAIRSAVQCGVWQDDMTLWQHTITVSPDSYVAHANLGGAYERLGPKFAPIAMAEFADAVRLYPDYVRGHENLAMELLRAGRLDEAFDEMKQILPIQDRLHGADKVACAKPRVDLAILLLDYNRPAEAIQYLEQAEALDPEYRALRWNLQRARHALGNTQPAKS